jgi:hypothetical protein
MQPWEPRFNLKAPAKQPRAAEIRTCGIAIGSADQRIRKRAGEVHQRYAHGLNKVHEIRSLDLACARHVRSSSFAPHEESLLLATGQPEIEQVVLLKSREQTIA